jgi:hypothetical protein
MKLFILIIKGSLHAAETSLLEWWQLISEKRSDDSAHLQEEGYNEALKAFLQ